ncbi:PTS mannitol transporter subunit IICB [Jeotgalibacillus salarius]|uniref:PTS system mannitol-specific EIICB component n=1 Tax=Jeotgalibacillus salarius TaxID=546023 RepID=A0A4Y8LHF8_9BACL|nr:PTS mannitol transporter subunit IICB [Jeotgalibacillus salarius]TFE02232.1 PTS mannitol transporter subunit IICB [Jeotgalibacillus salarius]
MAENKSGVRAKVQRFGSYLSGMIMPNMGAFIAWGLITALFIPTGWLPNEDLATVVGPMINYLLPLLIGFTGGHMIYGVRGGVLGATATIGAIVGTDIPMFLGAMILGPLGGYLIKQIDKLFEGKVKQGFEMLINNFTAGILGAILTLIAYTGVGPVVQGLNQVMEAGVQVIVNANLLPLVSIFVEPAKVLFLNNAINHGVIGPLALDQAAEAGKSILFMVESNPGPGLGILLAYMVFGKGMAKLSASGAGVIHFLGGIHEIYFPYILMKPILILAAILGGATGIMTFTLFDVGLVATPSPGSIFAYLAMTPRGDYIGMLAGVFASTAVSFASAGFLLKFTKSTEEDDALTEATERMQDMKGKKNQGTTSVTNEPAAASLAGLENVQKVIFACDAGMGSSAMGASLLRNKFKKADIDIPVSNSAINQIPDDADIIITHKDLTQRAVDKRPDARHISVDNFLGSPKYDELVNELKKNESA